MNELEQKLRKNYRNESDEVLFNGMEMDGRLKQAIREKAGLTEVLRQEKRSKPAFLRGRWAYSVAAAALVLVVAISAPQLYNSDPAAPGGLPSAGQGTANQPGQDGGQAAPDPAAGGQTSPDGGAAGGSAGGSSLSPLVTETATSTEEAKERFGDDLKTPGIVPEGFQSAGIETTGLKAGEATRVVYFYRSGDKEFTYMADRQEAVIPLEFFSDATVGGAEAHVFAQESMTELYWIADGVQYSIVGNLTEAEAKAVAESLE